MGKKILVTLLIFDAVLVSLYFLFKPSLSPLPIIKNTVENIKVEDGLDEKETILIATGDVMLGRYVNYTSVKNKDYRWPFVKTADFLKAADITFINLENPLIDNCSLKTGGMIFCGDKGNIEGLVFAGVDMVSLANNHTANFGEDGVAQTVDALNQNGIKVTGVDGPVYIEVNGIKFSFLGYNDISSPQPGISNFTQEKVKTEIARARQNSDVVVVAVHWGAEYRDEPDARQIYLGHYLVDAGADLVIGNHPHWAQPTEDYKGKYIVYALGNFVFDQMWSEKTRIGNVVRFAFCGVNVCGVNYFPVKIEDYGQPHF